MKELATVKKFDLILDPTGKEKCDIVIKRLKKEFLPLAVDGVKDKEGYEKVRRAKGLMVSTRTSIEGGRKELNEDAQTFIKNTNAEAKRLIGEMAPVEEHLKAELKKVDDEKKRIAEEKARKVQEKAQGRLNQLQAVNASLSINEIIALDDATFENILKAATETFEIEKARLAEIEKQKKEEAERLEKQRKEQEEIAEQQRQAQEKIDKEREKIEAEKRTIAEAKAKEEAEKLRQAEIEAAKKRAKKEAEEELKRKELAKLEAEKKAKAKAERLERLKPDKEKLLAFAETIKATEAPVVKSDEAKVVVEQVQALINKIYIYIQERSNTL